MKFEGCQLFEISLKVNFWWFGGLSTPENFISEARAGEIRGSAPKAHVTGQENEISGVRVRPEGWGGNENEISRGAAQNEIQGVQAPEIKFETPGLAPALGRVMERSDRKT